MPEDSSNIKFTFEEARQYFIEFTFKGPQGRIDTSAIIQHERQQSQNTNFDAEIHEQQCSENLALAKRSKLQATYTPDGFRHHLIKEMVLFY